MLARRYATLDPITIGSALELREGGLILTFDTNGTTLGRHARATQGLNSGRHQWQVIVYGDGTLEQLADTAAIGVVIAGTSTASYPGQAATTVGYRPGDGTCRQNGAVVATVATAPLRSVIGCALDLVDGAPTLRVYINRLLVHTFALPTGQTWFPAVAIGGATAYGFGAFVNFGQRAFEDTPLPDYREGVYVSPQPFPAMRLASDDWMSPATATPAHIAYAGDLLGARQFAIDKAISFWPWGDTAATTGMADLEIDNASGRYGALIGAPRQVRLVFKVVDRDAPGTAPVVIGTAYADRGELPTPRRARLRVRDVLARLRVPAQKRYFLPYTPEGTAGRVWPISYGACRSVAGILVDPLRRSYVAADRALTQVGVVRDRGDRLDPLATPPDWTVRSDLRGVELQEEPEGKVVLDVASAGRPMIAGAPDVDVLAGDGAMTTAVSGMPSHWVRMTGLFDDAAAAHVSTGGGRLRTETSGIIPADISVTWDVRYRDLRSEPEHWLPIRKGCYYRLSWKVQAAYWPTTMGFGQFAAGWYIKGAGKTALAGGVTTTFAPGEYSIDFRAECDGTLSWHGSGNIDPANNGGSTGPWWIEIDDVVCLLKSAATPDRLEGTGHLVAGDLSYWTAAASSGGSSAYGTIVTAEYPSPGLGCLAFSLTAGAGRYAERYCNINTLQANVDYRVALSTAGSTANARLRIYAWNNVTNERFLLDTVVGAVDLRECPARVGAAWFLLLRAEATDTAAATVKVSLVRALNLAAQLAESATQVPLRAISLTDFCRDVIEARAGLGSGAWVAADATAIDAATGYGFGVHAAEAVTCEALLRAPLDSFTAALTTDEQDRIRLVRLIDPETVSNAQVVLDIVQGINTRGDVSYVPDYAPGLTLRAGARRNWSLHTDSDFVADYDPVTGIDAASRTRLKRQSQFLVASARPLAALYEDARDAGAKEFLHDLSRHAQTELDRVCTLYEVVRGFYTVEVLFDGIPPPIRPGQIVRLTADLPGLESGRKLLVRRVRRQDLAPSLTLVGWGKGQHAD